MPRETSVKVAEVLVSVKELRIGELKALIKSSPELISGIMGANDVNDLVGMASKVLEEKLPQMFPELTASDIDNAYPSEIEALVGGFVDANFHGLKRVVTPLLELIRAGLATRFLQN